MSHHPYKNLPYTRFWSSGVATPVSSQSSLAVEPLSKSLLADDIIVSGGSCFAQYIGQELTRREFRYLRSTLSGERIESFGLGNIYTITQLRQWLEYALGQREWSTDSTHEQNHQWFDLLLPHREALSSEQALHDHRIAIRNELISYLKKANVFIFTVGLTESWRSPSDEVYPTCPGTLVGEFDESTHTFHNSTFGDIHSDLIAVEKLLTDIHPSLQLLYTVSPVPLTATASDDHILLATTYSKSVIRAAVGQYTHESDKARYFPSYELISHHEAGDWRFEENLRSISSTGVRYVMGHAFGEQNVRSQASQRSASPTDTSETHLEAACEEELLNSYSRLTDSANNQSNLVFAGDCHIGKLASGFRTAGIDVTGGIVMHGSSFTDYKFELNRERIFLPLDSEESRELWFDIHNKMTALKGQCHIITNIGFQTHRTINTICNHYGTAVITEQNVADYFNEFYVFHMHILNEFTQFGTVWMVEDPDFHAFVGNKSNSQIIRAKNFHTYCGHVRRVAQSLGIQYLNPCNTALQNLFADSVGLRDIITDDGFLGTQTYYEYCAHVVNAWIGHDTATLDRAA